MFDCVLYAGMFGVLFTYIIRKCSTTYYGIFYTVPSYFRKFQMCRNRPFLDRNWLILKYHENSEFRANFEIRAKSEPLVLGGQQLITG